MTNITDTDYLASPVQKLFATVVAGGYCIGCGACASLEGSPISMQLDEYSMYKATLAPSEDLSKTATIDVETICPFSNSSYDEDYLGNQLFGTHAIHDKNIGYYLSTYAGHVIEGEFRKEGSSGGMGSWIVSNLLKNDYIDSVIHVHQRLPTPDDKRLFHYQLSTSETAIKQSAKSRYYPIELSEMIKLIRTRPGRYAIVGLPCFIKAIRLLSKNDTVLQERVKFCIGLVCGHLKSTRFAELFAWDSGIQPQALKSIDFRTKLEGRGANNYGVTVTTEEDSKPISKVSPPIHEIFGANWGYGFFKYKACDYCDDVVAETADVTIGDAWLPQYVNDSLGTNIIIVRNPIIEELLLTALQENRISLDKISPDEVTKSQSSGFAHRREGLAYRLHLADQKKLWRPSKRVIASYTKGRMAKKQGYRIKMSELSHVAFNAAINNNDLSVFRKMMMPIVRKYARLYQKPLWKRIIDKLLSQIN